MNDLTGILIPEGQLTADEILAAVRSRPYGNVFVRVRPLQAVHLDQIEVHDSERGFPCEDPELVAALSTKGKAAFVHINHEAKQAMLHAFVAGKGAEGVATEPGPSFETKLREAVGAPLEQIVSADDGSRLGIGITASGTMALSGSRILKVPAGIPTGLGSFSFHDRGDYSGSENGRLVFVAYDAKQATEIYFDTPADALVARIEQAPSGTFGPLEVARVQVVETLLSLGKRTAREAELKDVRTLELCALLSAAAFSGGEALDYWNERILPIFSLSDQEPVIGESELSDLAEMESILSAMVEVLPYRAPPGGEGAMVPMIADREISPLAPWAKEQAEYHGAIFTLRPDRLLSEVRTLDGERLSTLINRFEQAWFSAEHNSKSATAIEDWRKKKQEASQSDLSRFATMWAKLRTLLEIALPNQLAVGLLFYG